MNAKMYIELLQKAIFSEFEDRDIRQETYERIAEVNYKKMWEENPNSFEKLVGCQVLPQSEKEFKVIIEAFLSRQKEFIFSSSSKYENPYTNNILNKLKKTIEEVLIECGYKNDISIYVGTLPSGNINAEVIAMKPPHNEILMIVDSGFFTMADIFSKVAARCLVKSKVPGDRKLVRSYEELDTKIQDSGDLADRFASCLESIIFHGDSRVSPLDIAPDGPDVMEFANYLREFMELFMVAHEYGHIIYGHVNPQRTHSLHLAGNVESINALDYSWLDEYQADKFAYDVLSIIAKKRGETITLVLWSIELFFSCIYTIDKAICFYSGLDYRSFYGPMESHPLAVIRHDYLQYCIEKEHPQAASLPAVNSKIVFSVFDGLWNRGLTRQISNVSLERNINPKWKYKTVGSHQQKREQIGLTPFDYNQWLDKNKRD